MPRYVLVTARQPFGSTRTHQNLDIMRRVMDETFVVTFPPYVTPECRDFILGRVRPPPAAAGTLFGFVFG